MAKKLIEIDDSSLKFYYYENDTCKCVGYGKFQRGNSVILLVLASTSLKYHTVEVRETSCLQISKIHVKEFVEQIYREKIFDTCLK